VARQKKELRLKNIQWERVILEGIEAEGGEGGEGAGTAEEVGPIDK
jgi:hypothetical protein